MGQIFYPLTHSWDVYCQRNPRESKVISWIYFIVKWTFIFVFLIIFLTIIGVFGKMPTTEELKMIESANASEVYSADDVMIGKYYTENRTTIKLDSISPYLITALLAIEDKRFLNIAVLISDHGCGFSKVLPPIHQEWEVVLH